MKILTYYLLKDFVECMFTYKFSYIVNKHYTHKMGYWKY